MQRRRVMLAGARNEQPQYLYNRGTISPLIGGFDTSKQLWTCPDPWIPAVFRDTYIEFKGSNSIEHIAGALLPVDLTPYKVLCADVNIGSTFINYSACRISVFSRPHYQWNTRLAGTPEKGMGLGRMVVKIDISSINRIAYIGASAGGSPFYVWDLYELWLEK